MTQSLLIYRLFCPYSTYNGPIYSSDPDLQIQLTLTTVLFLYARECTRQHHTHFILTTTLHSKDYFMHFTNKDFFQ